MTTHTLSEADVCLALDTALRRIRETGNGKHKRRSDEPDLMVKFRGFASEIAVARIFNVEPKLHDGITDGYDLLINGHRVDVKSITRKHHQLIVPSDTDVQCDRYILVFDQIPVFKLMGWCPAEQLIHDFNLTNLGYGPTYALKKETLHAF